nr:MAG TPA: hypothetical protein [Caudoviricetes sp.]
MRLCEGGCLRRWSPFFFYSFHAVKVESQPL